ncbi:MAG: ABC transporter ATP-binding protein, partial [Clostridiales bacterium]|nr:ABC transporter ATP-binding protein [Clostridiales bacterium]
REIISRGVSMAFIPEDRLGMGLVGGMDLPDNLLLKTYRAQKGPMLSRRGARKQAEELVQELQIVTPGIGAKLSKLSGGNVQKVLLGREIRLNPRVLITAYPVRGLDIGASMRIYDMLNEQKDKGVAILFVGEDLDVLLGLCDRVLVLCQGQVSAIVNTKFATKALLGMKMAGLTTDKEDEYV